MRITGSMMSNSRMHLSLSTLMSYDCACSISLLPSLSQSTVLFDLTLYYFLTIVLLVELECINFCKINLRV